MANARKKAKQEKKAKARKQKAKDLRAARLVARKASGEKQPRETSHGTQAFGGDGKRASSKPAARHTSKVHRTQGK